jgi:hypothetical protein
MVKMSRKSLVNHPAIAAERWEPKVTKYVLIFRGRNKKGGATGRTKASNRKGGVPESRAGAGRVRQESTAAAGRVSRAQFHALLRDGRDAALPSTRTPKHSEAATDPCGRVQSERDLAQVAGRGHAAGVEKPRWHASFVHLFTAQASGNSEWAPAQSTGNISDNIRCGITKPNIPLAAPQIRYMHHRLLGSGLHFYRCPSYAFSVNTEISSGQLIGQVALVGPDSR